MRAMSLRWALVLGGIAAVLGMLAAFVGTLVVPRSGLVDINHAVVVLLVAGITALLALAIALGLAYYAGLRVEQLRPRTSAQVDPDLDPAAERRDSALAGLIVMAIYWLATTLYGVISAPHTAGTDASGAGSLLVQRLVVGVVLLLLGFGLGALGSRAPAARRLLDEIAAAPPATLAPSPAPPHMPAGPPDQTRLGQPLGDAQAGPPPTA